LRKWWVSLLVLVALTGGTAVRAQDDAGGHLTDEQRALIDRVVQVHDSLSGYQSYHEETDGIDNQAITVILGTASRTVSRAVAYAQSVDLMRIDREDNVRAEASAVVTNWDETSYTVNAEARIIDGVLYVDAAFVPPAPEQLTLPDGWAIVEDPANLDVYDDLQLDNLLEPSSLYDDAALLKAMASDVSLEARTLDDGTPIEVITMVFEREGLIRYWRETDGEEIDPLSELLYTAMKPSSYAQAMLTIGPDETPLQFELTSVIETAASDAQTLASGQFVDGTTLSIRLEWSGTNVFSRINEPLEPASVPEEFAE
jgi:hypothetical protein